MLELTSTSFGTVVVNTLRFTQNTSGAIFGVFVGLHLSAPLLASVAPGGEAESLASQVMVLGRVYYQDSRLLERVILWSGVVHALSGLAIRAVKNVLRFQRRKRRQRDVKAMKELAKEASYMDDSDFVDVVDLEDSYEQIPLPEPEEMEPAVLVKAPVDDNAPFRPLLPNFNQKMGYALIPLTLVHYTVHRYLPVQQHAPEFSYSFVSYALGLPGWEKVAHYAAYGALASVGLYHCLVGFRVILTPRGRTPIPSLKRRKRDPTDQRHILSTLQVSYISLLALISIGVVRIGREGNPLWLRASYARVLEQVYSLVRRVL